MLGDGGITSKDSWPSVPSMEKISGSLEKAILPFIAKAAESYDGQVKIPSGPSVDLYRIQSYKQGSTVPVRVRYFPIAEHTEGAGVSPIRCVCGADGSLYPIGPNFAEHGRNFRDNVAEESIPNKHGASKPFPVISLAEHRQLYKGHDIPLATALPSQDGWATVHLIELHPASLAHGHFDLENVIQGLKDTLSEIK